MTGSGRPRPERTCVGCREKAPKESLVRVVRGADGVVSVDLSGRAAGRGAYVHAREECLRRASRGGTLARALRARLDADQVGRLVAGFSTTVGET